MNTASHILTLSTALGALGVWLMLPRGGRGGRGVGLVLAAAGLGLGASRLAPIGSWAIDGAFWVFAAATIVSAAATVTFRNPIYCAVWFGQSVLGAAGLFFLAGAQFLAVAAVVVYAGAILVTLLFVLMLAQPEGRAVYDRASWESLLSSAVGMILAGALAAILGGAFCSIESFVEPPSTEALAHGVVLAPQHVARLGVELWGRHLAAVEAAGALMLAALIGASAIVAFQKKEGNQQTFG